MGLVLGYEDWDTMIKKAEGQLKLMEATKKNIAVAGECEGVVLKFAREQRDKYPKPKEENSEKKEEKA